MILVGPKGHAGEVDEVEGGNNQLSGCFQKTFLDGPWFRNLTSLGTPLGEDLDGFLGVLGSFGWEAVGVDHIMVS